jgi:hypothetical protein
MARLYVTSSRIRAQRAREVCSELSVSGSYEGKRCFARSYRKPASNEESFLRVGQDRFLAIAGTAIFNGGLGEERKEEIYELFVDGGVESVRSKILGHYAIVIKRNNEVTLFTDPLGSFSLYYTLSNESWFASNSLHACAVSCDHVSLDATRLIATILQSGLPADRTIYQEIRRLFGTQVLRANTADGSLHVENCDLPTYSLPERPASVSEAVDLYGERVRSVFERIAKIEDTGVMLTGGLDSRTVLAGLLEQGKAPTILSGTGNNSTKPIESDYQIARRIAKSFGLDFHKMDWSDRQPHSRVELKKSFRRHGFRHEVYGSPKSMVEYLEGAMGDKPKLILGGYSPSFTDIEPWNINEEKLNIEDLIKNYIDDHFYSGNIKKESEYKNIVYNDTIRSIKNRKNEFRCEGGSKKEFSKSRLDLRINRDARFANFVNNFTHYIDPFRLKKLYDPLKNIDPKFRDGRRFQIGVISSKIPNLTKIEAISRFKKVKVSNGVVEEKKFEITWRDKVSAKYVKEKTKNILDKFVPSAVAEAVDAVRKASSAVWPQVHKDHAMEREYSRRLSDHKVVRQCVRDVPALSLKALARLEYFIVGIDSVDNTIKDRSSSDPQT